jgi:hypothetical protein
MPRIKRVLPSAEFEGLRRVASDNNEKGDCAVKALVLLTGLPYAQVNQALIEGGRKPRRGTQWWVMDRGLEILGFKREKIDGWIEKMIASYPGGHSRMAHITTHHPRRFKKQWQGVEPLLLDCSRHVAAFKDGVVHDWTINQSMRVNNVFRIVRVEPAAELEPIEEATILIDGKDPLVVLLEEHQKTLAARRGGFNKC